MNGKCPKCEKPLGSVNVDDIDIKVRGRSSWKGIQYVCPFCQTIVGVQMDPVALKTDTVQEIADALKTK